MLTIGLIWLGISLFLGFAALFAIDTERKLKTYIQTTAMIFALPLILTMGFVGAICESAKRKTKKTFKK